MTFKPEVFELVPTYPFEPFFNPHFLYGVSLLDPYDHVFADGYNDINKIITLHEGELHLVPGVAYESHPSMSLHLGRTYLYWAWDQIQTEEEEIPLIILYKYTNIPYPSFVESLSISREQLPAFIDYQLKTTDEQSERNLITQYITNRLPLDLRGRLNAY